MIRVAVDAMGGDSAPQAEIAGVIQALAAFPSKFIIQLVGRPDPLIIGPASLAVEGTEMSPRVFPRL